MTSFYDKYSTEIDPNWFKKDIWSHEEAACLFCGINPTPDTLHFQFNPMHQSQMPWNKVLELRDIFAATAWPHTTGSHIENGKRPYEDYFDVAKSKGIRISNDLIKLHNAEKIAQSMNHKTPSSPTGTRMLTPKMQATLQPIIKIIEEFEQYGDYKLYDINIQQQKIGSWLEDKVDTEHENRHLKDLITKHYNITSGRK